MTATRKREHENSLIRLYDGAPPELLTVVEVANFLRLNPQTVYRFTKSGRLPSIRLGRAIRFRSSDILKMEGLLR